MSRGGNHIALFLARRMQWRRAGHRRSPAVTIAVSGVALSIMVMLVSVAVVTGFKREVRHSILRATDAVTITATEPLHGTDPAAGPVPVDTAAVIATVRPLLPEGTTVTPRSDVVAILKTDSDFLAVSLSGDPRHVPADSTGSLVISAIMARQLGLQQGQSVPAYFFSNDRLRSRMLTVSGIYSSGLSEHDRSVAYCSPTLAATMLHLPEGTATAIGINGIEPEESPALASELQLRLLHALYSGHTVTTHSVTTVMDTDSLMFAWLDLLDTNVVVILALMAAVASFTLISSLFIIILERVRTIGLLKAMGADNRLVRRTFMLLAERLVVKGLLIGNALALVLILVQQHTHLVTLDPENYYVDFVPVELSWPALPAVNLGALLLSWCVLMLPAIIIARISPASTMRYE